MMCTKFAVFAVKGQREWKHKTQRTPGPMNNEELALAQQHESSGSEIRQHCFQETPTL